MAFTSSKPRAFETAIAMGYAVEEQLDVLAEWTDDLFDAADHGGFAAVGALVRRAWRRRQSRPSLWAPSDIARSLGDDQAALIVSHSGVVEGVMACLPELDGIALGHGVGYCEGVRLTLSRMPLLLR